jgi:non-specific serine/threonine protein kinase
VPGEVLFPVPPLPLPSVPLAERRGQIHDSEAVRFFIVRARAVQPDFSLTTANAPAVEEICRRLDGIPLAIEMAAARIRSLSPKEIAARLDDQMRFLETATPLVPTKHLSLQASLDWSYGLLGRQEKILFRRLACFAGGASIKIIEAVCGWRGAGPGTILRTVARLVDRSLLSVVEIDGETRYQLLEPIRQYARAKLQGSGEAHRVTVRHRDAFLTLAERGAEELHKPDQRRWLIDLERERDNFRVALDWSLQQDHAETALRLAVALFHLWSASGAGMAEGRRWLDRVLAGTPGASPILRSRAIMGAAFLAYADDDLAHATEFASEGLVQSRMLGDRVNEAMCLRTLAFVAIYHGDYASSAQLLLERIAIHRQFGPTWALALALGNLASTARNLGDYQRAQSLWKESLDVANACGDINAAAAAFGGMGWLAYHQGGLLTGDQTA